MLYLWLSWLSKCSGTINAAIAITWCRYQWHHLTKKVIMHLLLIIFKQMEGYHWWHLALCDTDASTSGITWPKIILHTVWLSWLNKYSVPLMIPLLSHDADAKGITWPKRSCCISFWSPWPNKWNGAIDDTVSYNNYTSINGIKWPKNYVALCFISVELMNTMVILTIPLIYHDADPSCKYTHCHIW